LVQRAGQQIHFQKELRRADLEALSEPLLAALDAPCRRLLKSAGLRPSQIDQVVLVGGMTRMPAVHKRLEAVFERPASPARHGDDTVARGAALHAAILDGLLREVVVLDITAAAIGLRGDDQRMSAIVPRNSTLPTREHRIFATGEDNQTRLVIEVFQGDDTELADQRPLAELAVSGLPAARAGEVQVEVAFS